MDPLQRLSALEDIRMLKARYFRFVDTKDYDSLRTLFAPGCTLHFPESNHGPLPLDEALELIVTSFADVTSVHHGHMPEINILSAATASAIWPMEDQLFWPESSLNPHGLYRLHGAGHYHETYVRTERGWLIHTLKLTRLWRTVELLPSRIV